MKEFIYHFVVHTKSASIISKVELQFNKHSVSHKIVRS